MESGVYKLYLTPNNIRMAPKTSNPSLPKKPTPVSGTKVNIREITPKITATPLPLI